MANISQVYLPPKREGQQKSAGEEIQYNQEEASFYWAFSMPKQTEKYKEVKDIPDRRKFILDYVSDWAPELFVLPLSSSPLSLQIHNLTDGLTLFPVQPHDALGRCRRRRCRGDRSDAVSRKQ